MSPRWPHIFRKILGKIATDPSLSFNITSSATDTDFTYAASFFASSYEVPWMYARALQSIFKAKGREIGANVTGPELYAAMKANRYDGMM